MTMKSFDDFDERREVLDTGIRRGMIGCLYGGEAARAGRILYAPVVKGSEESCVLDALRAFSRDTTFRILLVIPEQRPQTHPEGQAVAWPIYSAALRACLELSRESRAPGSFRRLCASAIHRGSATESVIQRLVQDPFYTGYVCQHVAQDALCGLKMGFLNARTEAEELLVVSTMAPYYPTSNGVPHPRFAPYICSFFGYFSDVTRVMHGGDLARPRAIEATDRWIMTATGHKYKQGSHVPLRPLDPDTPVEGKDDWVRDHTSRQTSIGRLIEDEAEWRRSALGDVAGSAPMAPTSKEFLPRPSRGSELPSRGVRESIRPQEVALDLESWIRGLDGSRTGGPG